MGCRTGIADCRRGSAGSGPQGPRWANNGRPHAKYVRKMRRADDGDRSWVRALRGWDEQAIKEVRRSRGSMRRPRVPSRFVEEHPCVGFWVVLGRKSREPWRGKAG